MLGLALEGFDQLDGAAKLALQDAGRDPNALYRLAASFPDFSAAHPERIDLMYDSELIRPTDAALESAYRLAFEMVVGAVRQVLPGVPKEKALARAVAFWTSFFGLSRVLRQRMLDPFAGDIDGDWRSVVLDGIVNAATAA